MTEIKLTKRYPHSRTEDITDAYMRGWNDALDAVQNGKFHIADRKEEPQTICKSCRKYPCERYKRGMVSDKENVTECVVYEPKDESQTDCPWR